MTLRFSRPDRKPWRRRVLLWFVGGFLLFWIIGLLLFVYTAVPRTITEPARRTDAIVVLTGGSQRLETGLTLLADGLAPKLFISGVHRGVEVTELLRIARQEPGRLECCIFVDYNADDTIGNARETARWIKKHGAVSIRLVTAAYHMPRSLLEFRAVMPGIDIVPNPVFPPHVKQRQWYAFPGTAALFSSEYTKYLAARLRLVLERLTAETLATLRGTEDAPA